MLNDIMLYDLSRELNKVGPWDWVALPITFKDGTVGEAKDEWMISNNHGQIICNNMSRNDALFIAKIKNTLPALLKAAEIGLEVNKDNGKQAHQNEAL